MRGNVERKIVRACSRAGIVVATSMLAALAGVAAQAEPAGMANH